MTQVGKTLLKGHALRAEGAPCYGSDGGYDMYWAGRCPREGRAKCECGLLSEPGINKTAAQRWHREHKNSLR